MFVQLISYLPLLLTFTNNIQFGSNVHGVSITGTFTSQQYFDTFDSLPTSNSYSQYIVVSGESTQLHQDDDYVDFYITDGKSNYFKYCSFLFNHEEFDYGNGDYKYDYYFNIKYYALDPKWNIYLNNSIKCRHFDGSDDDFYTSGFDYMSSTFDALDDRKYSYYTVERYNGVTEQIVMDCNILSSFTLYNSTVWNAFMDNYEGINQSAYQEGYDKGLIDGQQNYIDSQAYEDAMSNANEAGFNRGYNEGINTQTYTFGQLFGAIADTPIMIMYNLLGFDVFGVSALSIVMSMLTGCIVLFLIKKIIL